MQSNTTSQRIVGAEKLTAVILKKKSGNNSSFYVIMVKSC